MADNTIIQQGSFTVGATPGPVVLTLRSDIDWMEVKNYTQWALGTSGVIVNSFWQRGMAANDGIITTYSNFGATLPTSAFTGTTYSAAGFNGFTLIDNSINAPGALVAITAVSTANPPLVSTGSTAGLAPGSVVRLYNVVGAQQLGGIDFTVGTVVANTSFTLANMGAMVTVAGTTGNYAIIPYDPLFYPTNRYIASISQAANAVVVTTVNHAYVSGQLVRFNIGPDFGMTQINGLLGTVTVIDAKSFSVNINSTGFNAYAWPLSASGTFVASTVSVIGETANAALYNPNLLDDATVNTGYIGMQLGWIANHGGPAGLATTDVMYWVAGKSFSNTPYGS